MTSFAVRFLLGVFLLSLPASGWSQFTAVQSGAVWRYWDIVAYPGPQWITNKFDDTGWATGSGPLGYGNGGEGTVIGTGIQRPVTTYFRHEFVLSESTGLTALMLRLACDDGAVVYLNGREIYRRNLGAGPVDPLLFATARVEGAATKQFLQYPVPASWAQPGTNLVAVELHQHAAGLNDAWFDLELIANLPLTLPEVRIVTPQNLQTWPLGPIRFQVETSDRDGFVYLVRYWINSWPTAESTSETLDYWWTPPGPGRYRLVAEAIDNSGRRRESIPVYFQVGHVTETKVIRGPYLQSGSTTSVVVRWRTDWPADSIVRYGRIPDELDQVSVGPFAQEHEVKLTGLFPDTTYYYSVGGEDGAVIGGTGPDFRFTTAPEVVRPVRIWAIGDSGMTNDRPKLVRDAYLDQTDRTDLWLMLGDNAYEDGTDEQYQLAVFETYPSLLRSAVLWPTLGNHDATVPGVTEAFPYLEIFTLPKQGEAGGLASGTELYYSFDYANIHFICLDAQSSERTPGSPMLTWLENDLAATAKDWIIAFWHHPPYTWGTHNSDRELQLIQMRQFVVPILERYGTDLVLCGHSHVYERSFLLNGHYGSSSNFTSSMIVDSSTGNPAQGLTYRKPFGGLSANQGTAYVVCGCSGEGGSFQFPRYPAMAFNRSGFGSMIIDVNGLQMDVRFVTEQGQVADRFGIDKRPPGPLVRPQLEIRPLAAGVEITWPTSATIFQLQKRSTFTPSGPWQLVTDEPATVGRTHRLWHPIGRSNAVFRLQSAQ